MKLISKEKFKEIEDLFSKLSVHNKNIDKIINGYTVNELDKQWYTNDDISEAEDILMDFAKKSLSSGNNETTKKIFKVSKVISFCSQIYYKACSYEIMKSKYKLELNNQEETISKMTDRIMELEKENESLKSNLVNL